VQFERLGFFARDPDGTPERPVFNRVVELVSRRIVEEGVAEGTRGLDEVRAEVASPPAVQVSGQTPEDRISPEREAARSADPLLADRFARYRALQGVSLEDADLLTGEHAIGNLFEAALAVHDEPGTVAAWVTNDLRAAVGDRALTDLPFGGEAVGRLAALVATGRITRAGGREVLAELVVQGGDPEAIVTRRGLTAVADAGALAPIIQGILASRPDKVAEYRGGRTNLLGLFIGDVMRATRGTADPAVVRTLLEEALTSGGG
jgi:glutaminyl-tRNA synthetase